MEQYERKAKSIIREALILTAQNRLKSLGNPYAYLNNEEPDYKALNADSDIIYEHLKNMGIIK